MSNVYRTEHIFIRLKHLQFIAMYMFKCALTIYWVISRPFTYGAKANWPSQARHIGLFPRYLFKHLCPYHWTTAK